MVTPKDLESILKQFFLLVYVETSISNTSVDSIYFYLYIWKKCPNKEKSPLSLSHPSSNEAGIPQESIFATFLFFLYT